MEPNKVKRARRKLIRNSKEQTISNITIQGSVIKKEVEPSKIEENNLNFPLLKTVHHGKLMPQYTSIPVRVLQDELKNPTNVTVPVRVLQDELKNLPISTEDKKDMKRKLLDKVPASPAKHAKHVDKPIMIVDKTPLGGCEPLCLPPFLEITRVNPKPVPDLVPLSGKASHAKQVAKPITIVNETTSGVREFLQLPPFLGITRINPKPVPHLVPLSGKASHAKQGAKPITIVNETTSGVREFLQLPPFLGITRVNPKPVPHLVPLSGNPPNDETVNEILKVQSEVKPSSEYYSKMLKQVLYMAKDQLPRQEIIKKLKIVESEIRCLYKKLKNRTPLKTEEEQAWKFLNERDYLLNQLKAFPAKSIKEIIRPQSKQLESPSNKMYVLKSPIDKCPVDKSSLTKHHKQAIEKSYTEKQMFDKPYKETQPNKNPSLDKVMQGKPRPEGSAFVKQNRTPLVKPPLDNPPMDPNVIYSVHY